MADVLYGKRQAETGIVPESIFGEPKNYTRWGATIQMTGAILGGVPSNPKLIEGWLRGQAGIRDDEAVQAMVNRTLQERGYAPEEMRVDEVEEAVAELAGTLNQSGFKRDENGLYIEGRQIMSMLRESVSVLYTGHKWKRPTGGTKATGENLMKAANSVFRECVHVPTERVYLGKDKADNISLKIVHPKDEGRGRESSLTYVEECFQPTLEFEVEEIRGTVPDGGWRKIWQHAERNGLGAMRSQQHGKFHTLRWEQLN